MGNYETGHRAFTVYYAEREKMLLGQDKGEYKAGTAWFSTFVTRGALLGIKSIGSNAEHVVALDADAVDDGADNGTGLQRFGRATCSWSSGFLGGAFSGHERILARRGEASIGVYGIPWTERTHLLEGNGAAPREWWTEQGAG
jgi:hypothetical protein